MTLVLEIIQSPQNFSLSFDHKEEIMRFGTVYKGETNFQIEDSPVSSFTPLLFLWQREV